MQGEIVPPRNATTPIPQIVTSFASVMRRARHDAGLTQAKLAAGAGISLRYVTLLEKGEYQASITVLQNVASALGRPLWEMIREAEAGLDQSSE